MSGRLLVVGTPIGNLEDLSDRARQALTAADVIACEDTRRTGRLLSLTGIAPRKLLRFDDHTESDLIGRILDQVAAGSVVAVVSDAGMPGLADPGSRLVDAAIDKGVLVEVIPGPFAGAVALVASGVLGANSRFCFEGFLPRKGAARRDRIAEFVDEQRPVVFYEAPHRLAATIDDLRSVVGGQRRVALCRELTKLHEEVVRCTLDDAAALLESRPAKGEYVVVLDSAPPPAEVDDDQIVAALQSLVEDGATGRDAVASVVERFGVARNRTKRLLTEATEA